MRSFEELRTSFRGKADCADDAEFDEARRVWNGTIDRRPGLIAQCSGAADVITAVKFAGLTGCSSPCAAVGTAGRVIRCATTVW